ncbi:DUF4397 domain-containing protein [Paraflavitalea soli]|uniref:DUF4397 domain-containing protein n=1 Tax=Paraflavitalea soli TaxID=2315862 RepID=A0A3B7MQJ8_9BACT|nr:DUF4397 domain-containing protein [Paraflavitalea soli]AXY72881.1 DUF4397 domain-containing protein [Paraflavitalea soli]
MNKALNYLRRSLIPVIAVISVGILFTACLKDKDNGPDIPAAGLMAFNLAPDQPALVVRLSGNSLTQAPLDYTSYTGVYQNIYTGSRPVEAFDYRNGSRLTSTNYTFEANKYYSLFVIGTDSAYKNIVSIDNFDSLTTTDGKAYVRYINAITDSVNNSTVTVTANGSNVVNDNAAYGTVSEFKAVTPGQISVAVKNNNGVNASRDITLEQKKIYTILLVGKPGATDDKQKVQIRFIANGTVTDDTSKQ